MKQFQIILGLILFAAVSTFAQSPRIKLNQITKDTVKGSVLISNPTDSGMVYSRDFYIAYGADTVLILYGDTLAATSGIISSVLSDGVTITGNGTSGNELKADTSIIATIKALNDSLATVSASTTPDGVTITGDGSVGNPLKVDTLLISTIQGLVDTLTASGYLTANETITLSGDVTGSGTTAITATVVDDSHNHIISNVDFLQDSLTAKANASELSNYVTIAGTDTITGAKTFTANTVFDDSTLVVDATNNRVGIGTTSPAYKTVIDTDNGIVNIGDFSGGRVGIILNLDDDSSTGGIFGVGKTGNSYTNFNFNPQGKLQWGTGSAVWDVNLYRNAANQLKTDDELIVGTLSSGKTTAVYHTGGVLGTIASDARLKKNIFKKENVLSKVLDINVVNFEYISNGIKDFGFIAQELMLPFPELVFLNDTDGFYGVHYEKIGTIAVKAIQEQQAQIETIQAELDAKQTEIDQLKTLITDLTNRLTILENK